MPDIFTKAKRSEVTAAIFDRKNNATELRMIALLRARDDADGKKGVVEDEASMQCGPGPGSVRVWPVGWRGR